MADWSKEPESKDHWPKGFDPTNTEKEERDAYLRHKNWVYSQEGLQDCDLWEQYQEDFEGWTIEYLDSPTLFTLEIYKRPYENMAYGLTPRERSQ